MFCKEIKKELDKSTIVVYTIHDMELETIIYNELEEEVKKAKANIIWFDRERVAKALAEKLYDMGYTLCEPNDRIVPFSRRLKIGLTILGKSLFLYLELAIVALVVALIGVLIFACLYGVN